MIFLKISKKLSLLTNNDVYLSVVNFGKFDIQYIYVLTLLPNNYMLCPMNRLGALKINGNIITIERNFNNFTNLLV